MLNLSNNSKINAHMLVYEYGFITHILYIYVCDIYNCLYYIYLFVCQSCKVDRLITDVVNTDRNLNIGNISLEPASVA